MSEPRIIVGTDTHVVREADETISIVASPEAFQGTPGVAGPAGLNGSLLEQWDGDWNSSNVYEAGAVVHNAADGALYLCLAPNTNQLPNSSGVSAYWSLLVSRGATGDAGPQGDPGVGEGGATNYYIPTWRSAWSSSSRAYAVGDWVRYEGSAYHCKAAHTSTGSNGPLDDSTKWSLAVSKGTQGSTGSRGATGEQGLRGLRGLTGAASTVPGPAGSNGTDAYADIAFTFAAAGTQTIAMPRTVTFTGVVGGGTGTPVIKKNGTTVSIASHPTFSPGHALGITVTGAGYWTLQGHYGS